MYEEIMKNVYRIDIPLPNNPLKELNSYVLLGKDRNLVIDTGFRMDECRQALTGALKELHIDMENTDVLLTHMHSDHAGLVPDIVSDRSRVFVQTLDRVWLMPGTKEQLESEEQDMYHMAGIPDELLAQVYESHPGYKMAPEKEFDRYEEIIDGDEIPVGGYRLKVIHTPGHTPGNICLWMEEQQVLFSGDHVLFDITPHIQKWPNLAVGLKRYLEALRMIQKYPAKQTFPGHRKSGDLHKRVDELLAHHEFRLNECLQVVTDEPGMTAYDITGRMTWRIRAKNWDEFPASQKWFAVGECLSHLDFLMDDNRVRKIDDGGIFRFEPV
ncbi:MAG: MBL fold metallo-hydrolase [Lachnospiraceae bacterium]|nr:MBL fold metallo-hydrolase [Lachnospiraceae bacterium]